MSLNKYFKEEQKILLRVLNGDAEAEWLDALTCYLKDQGAGYVDLALPYGTGDSEGYPFEPEKTFEIISESLGVGVRLTGHFDRQLGKDLVRIRHNSDLQLIHRRVEDRRTAVLELGYTKGRGKLRSFRDQWEKNIRILQNTKDLSKLPRFPKIEVNISMTGVGFRIKTPLQVADLCLLFINLDDGQPPVCTMTEVVWRGEDEADGRCMAGFQFLNILETDRKRIRRFVRATAKDKT